MNVKIIPVIDLLSGQVVRAVRGERHHYRPLSSLLIRDASPPAVVNWLRENLDSRTIYLADLDAIGGRTPNLDAIEAILRTGVNLWLDLGVVDAEQAARWSSFFQPVPPQITIIVGLESVKDLGSLAAIVEQLGTDRAMFSLDLRGGRVRTADPAWVDADPLRIVDAAVAAGFRKLIVLDLAGVGAREGLSSLTLCREIRRRYAHLELVTGGGVRDLSDLRDVCATGCDAVLVATALYEGTVTRADMESLA